MEVLRLSEEKVIRMTEGIEIDDELCELASLMSGKRTYVATCNKMLDKHEKDMLDKDVGKLKKRIQKGIGIDAQKKKYVTN